MIETVFIEAKELNQVHPVAEKTKALLVDLDAQIIAQSLAERLLMGNIDSFEVTTEAITSGIAEAIDEIDNEVFTAAVEHLETTVREQLANEAKEIALELLQELVIGGGLAVDSPRA